MTMAVPVSWHIGSTPPAEMLTFLSRSSATKRSLPLASGSSMIRRSWARWAGRRKCAMSCMASSVSSRSASGSTCRNGRPPSSSTRTPSVVSSRYGVRSGPIGSRSEETGSGVADVLIARA